MLYVYEAKDISFRNHRQDMRLLFFFPLLFLSFFLLPSLLSPVCSHLFSMFYNPPLFPLIRIFNAFSLPPCSTSSSFASNVFSSFSFSLLSLPFHSFCLSPTSALLIKVKKKLQPEIHKHLLSLKSIFNH